MTQIYLCLPKNRSSEAAWAVRSHATEQASVARRCYLIKPWAYLMAFFAAIVTSASKLARLTWLRTLTRLVGIG